VTFEYTGSTVRKPHSLLFVGGLGDGIATTSYMSSLVYALQPTQWSLFTLNLTSSYTAWGLGYLDRDTTEIAQCIEYINEYKQAKFGGGGKVVLMGHSTGSQDVLHYLYRSNPHTSLSSFDQDLQHIKRPVIDGAIMQAPVSDREAIHWVLEKGIGNKAAKDCRAAYDKLIKIAREAANNGHAGDVLLPLDITGQLGYPSTHPVSCRRFLSLVSPDSPNTPQEDDLFSSDISDEQLNRTFGMIHQQALLRYKLLVMPSGADQAVPDWVDKPATLARWQKAVDHDGQYQIWDAENSGPIPNASHALSNDDQAEPRQYLVEKVQNYLNGLEKALIPASAQAAA
jgi:pimeloyl-ACP methyl ester carboxylesterase